MSKSNWTLGEAYKPSEEKRAELRETMKVWDFDDEFAWKDNTPWWLRSLQVVGFVAAGIGLAVCIRYSILVLFLI